MTSNNPFPDRYGPGTLFPPDVLFWPQPIQYTEEEIYNISESRFLNVVGIAATMIFDDFLATGSGDLGEPPFVAATTQ